MFASRSEQPAMCAVPRGPAAPGVVSRGPAAPGVVPRPLVWCALLALLCAAAGAAADKRAEMSPVPFVLGSRYGRSPPRVMAPRNDRFFMGSRYGKRADGGGGALVCRYTGLLTLYTCAHAPPTTTHKRSDEELPAGGSEGV